MVEVEIPSKMQDTLVIDLRSQISNYVRNGAASFRCPMQSPSETPNAQMSEYDLQDLTSITDAVLENLWTTDRRSHWIAKAQRNIECFIANECQQKCIKHWYTKKAKLAAWDESRG